MTAYNPSEISAMDINIQQPQSQSASTKLKSIALRLGTLFSYLGNVIIAYVTMYEKNIQMAKEYFIYVTPAKPFFKIWIVIYVSLLLVIVHNMWRNVWKTKSSLIFILSNCLFMISSGIWSLRTIDFVALSGIILATVDNATIWFWRVLIDQHMEAQKKNEESQQQVQATSMQIENQQIQSFSVSARNKQIKKYSEIQLFIVRNVLSFYIGWVTVAGTVITGLVCVHWWGLTLCQQFIFFWITTPIAATALYIFLALKMKNQYKYCFGYILSVSWGLIGASMASINNINQRNYC